MAALGIGATVIAVPRALSGIVAVPQVAEAGISRTAAATPSSKPSTAKMPVWSASPTTARTAATDTRPPSPVTGLRLMANNDAAISISWDAGQDNVAVKLYVVKGVGFTTVQTADTKATVSWPHRTANVSIQVSAVDTSGNQGEWRSLVVVPPFAAVSATTPPEPTSTSGPPSTTDPAVTTTAPSEAASTDTASTAASTDSSAVQTAAVQDPGTGGVVADPSSTQPV